MSTKLNPDLKWRLPAFQRHPRNCWYIAAGGAEITDKPLRREILGEFLVFFRDASGKVVVARDACPHRGYRLSEGYLKEGVLQCGYHGIKFDGSGKCVGIPNNPSSVSISDNMCLKMYPAVEKWVWVWVWMGDPELADPSLLPDVDCETWEGYEHTFISPVGPHLGNAQLIRENLCDSSHVSYLHATHIDSPDDTAMTAPRKIMYSDDRTILFRGDMPDFYAHEDSAAFFNLEPGRTYHFRQDAWHHLPGLVIDHNRFYLPENKGDDENLGPLICDHTVTIGVTPANDREFYHMTALSTNLPQTEKQKKLLIYVIDQDVVAADMMQTNIEKNWEDAVEVSVPSDRIGILARRLVNKMVKAEDGDSDRDKPMEHESADDISTLQL